MKYIKRFLLVWQILLVLTLTANFNVVVAQTAQDNQLGEAQKLFDEAMVLYGQFTSSSLQTALTKFDKSAELFEKAGNPAKLAVSITMAGRIFEGLAKPVEALNSYNKALQISRTINDYDLTSVLYNNLGNILVSVNKQNEALGNYELAISTADKILDPKLSRINKSLTYYNLSRLYETAGNTAKAVEYLDKSIDLGDVTLNADVLATAITSLARIQSSLGDSKSALKLNEQALQIAKQLSDKDLEATIINNIGLVYYNTGDKKTALEKFDAARKILETVFDDALKAQVLNNTAMSYNGLGERQLAFDFLNKTLVLSRQTSNTNLEAYILNNFGLNYLELNDKPQALKYFNSALETVQKNQNKGQEATILLNLGELYSSNLDAENAFNSFAKALKISEDTLDIQLGCSILNNMGLLFLRGKEPQKAIIFLNRALPAAHEKEFRSVEAALLNNLGQAYYQLGENAKAADYYNQAIVVSQSIGNKNQVAGSLGNLMLFWNEKGSPQMAVFFGKQSINIYQQLRGNIVNLDKGLQKTYLNSIEQTYRQLAQILVARGRIAEAEQILGMLKQDEYFDYLRRDDKVADDLKVNISLTPEELEAFKRYGEIADKITSLGKEYSELETESKSFEAGKFPRQARLDELDKQLADANKVFNFFLDNLKQKFGENDKRVAVAAESGTQALLKEINEPHTVIISTIAGKDELNLIVTTADTQRAHTVDIKEADLNNLVADFRDAVKNPAVDPRPSGEKLYKILFPDALKKDLENIKAETIVWSLDGTLRYVPISALWDGRQYLVERYNNVLITLASRDKLNKAATDRTKWTALGVGVSKEADIKSPDGTTKIFTALTAVPAELCSVISDPNTKVQCESLAKNKTGIIKGKSLIDDEFTLQNFKNNLGRYPVIHIASHFSLNPGNEADSYLLLGGVSDRRFTLANLREGGAKFVGVELLTLSACNTAMGSSSKSNGVEVEGFGALAQQQGAKTVLASLWSVADASTRDLMTEFYAQLENNPKIGKAEALRQAQLKLIRGKYAENKDLKNRRSDLVKVDDGKTAAIPFTKDENAPFAHPYYWSPFVLFGNWK